jgi:sulfane dehydrogenase subunit SoxC
MKKTDTQASELLPKQALARWSLLMGSMGLVGGAAAGLVPGVSATGNNLRPNVSAWTRSLGTGVLTNPYGQPSPV